MHRYETVTPPRHHKKKFKSYVRSSKRITLRRLKKHLTSSGPSGATKVRQKAFFDRTLKHLSNMSDPSPQGRQKKNRFLKLPSSFCFIESPEEAIKAIGKAFNICMDPATKSLNIDHSKVDKYNLTSECLLGLVVDGALKQRALDRKKNTRRFTVRGWLPRSNDHHQLIREIGVIKETDSQKSCHRPYSDTRQHLFVKKGTGAAYADAFSNDKKTATSLQFRDYVNSCLNEQRIQLTEEARHELLTTVSEVLDNAERHSCIQGESHIWHIRGYLNSSSSDQNIEISIFNFGMTMAETFERLDDSNWGKKLVLEYVNAHESTFDREALITVAALQHRYSSKNISQHDNNGQGTVILIEFFESLCNELTSITRFGQVKPQMSIVSGSTHILFDGSYKLDKLRDYTPNDESDEQLTIAFNSEKSLKSPPDPKYVRSMKNSRFPGVAISIRFPLKEQDSGDE